MPVGSSSFIRTIANAGTQSPRIDMVGQRLVAIYVPTIDSGTVRLQGSHDGSTWADLKDTVPATLQFAASTGDFWMDADYLARFAGIPFLRIVTGAVQTAARDFRVTVARG